MRNMLYRSVQATVTQYVDSLPWTQMVDPIVHPCWVQSPRFRDQSLCPIGIAVVGDLY